MSEHHWLDLQQRSVSIETFRLESSSKMQRFDQLICAGKECLLGPLWYVRWHIDWLHDTTSDYCHFRRDDSRQGFDFILSASIENVRTQEKVGPRWLLFSLFQTLTNLKFWCLSQDIFEVIFSCFSDICKPIGNQTNLVNYSGIQFIVWINSSFCVLQRMRLVRSPQTS